MIINNNDYTNHFIVTAYRTDIDGVVLDSNIIFKTNANVDTNDIISIHISISLEDDIRV
jgi:hypothetical protein